jgi:hypothetical protein
MYSVAFQHSGIAYIVTTSDADSLPWLLPILQSWEFTE